VGVGLALEPEAAMICDHCGAEHVLAGEIWVDGLIVPRGWIETLAELLCKHGKLGSVEGGPEFGPPVS